MELDGNRGHYRMFEDKVNEIPSTQRRTAMNWVEKFRGRGFRECSSLVGVGRLQRVVLQWMDGA